MIIPINGAINESMYLSICKLTEKPKFFIGDNEIILSINSHGGSVYFMNEILKHIISLDFKTIGYVSGNAYSAAFVILQHCHEKIIHPKGGLMMHYPRYSHGGLINKANASGEERRVIRNYIKFLSDLSENTGLPLKMLKFFNKKEKIFNADVAKKLGLVDDICDMSYLVRRGFRSYYPRLF